MRRAAPLLLVALAGCAVNPAAIRPDAGSPEYQVDAYQCDYESSSSTATYGSGQNTARTYGGAIGQGIGLGIGQAMARNDLFVKCMRAKYAARAYGSPAASVPAAQLQPQPERIASAPAVAPSIREESKWMLQAEGVAKVNGCTPPNAAMTSKGAGQELFAVACPNGTTLAIRCEVDGCRVLR